jgi:hypothetical protein
LIGRWPRSPARARSEYLSEWRDDLADFVSREAVNAVTAFGTFELPPLSDVGSYYGFCDPSGGASDAMTLAIAHKEGDVAVLDCLRERAPPFSPDDVVAEFATTLKAYRITKIVGDRFAGEWVREPFGKCDIEYEASARPKSDLYRDALPLINSARVRLLDNVRLVNQLVGLERRTAGCGLLRAC